MGLSMIFTMMLYAYNIHKLNQGNFYVARTRESVTQIIDFEEITTKEVQYFLHRNPEVGNSDFDKEIIPDVAEACLD